MKQPPHVPQILLLIETSKIYGRQLVEGIGRYACEHGPWSINLEQRGLDELCKQTPGQWQVDGIISRLHKPSDLRQLYRHNLPVVELYGDPAVGIMHVGPSEDGIAAMAVDHLLSQGLHHFSFFAAADYWWAQDRGQAFSRQLEQHRYSCNRYPSPPPAAAEWSRQQARVIRWLRSLPQPSGILCATDYDALMLLDTCRQIGIAVPEQLAVMGVDNDPALCMAAWPPLTSIELDAQRIGYEAAALLERMMAGKPAPKEKICVPPQRIMARKSTDALASADPAIIAAVQFIRNWACKGISVSQVADHVAMTQRTLERRFQACAGRTMKQEILRVQIEQAKQLLTQGDQQIKRISRLSGFGSVFYFTRAFRRETGETPNAYRKRTRLP